MTASASQPAHSPAPPRRKSVVVALGSNALLGGGGAADAAVRRRNVAAAVDSISDLAVDHNVVVTHGSGLPGMIAYLLDQGLNEALPGREIATLRMRSVVDADELRTIRSLLADGVLVIVRPAVACAWSSAPACRHPPWPPPSTATSPPPCSQPAWEPTPC